MQSRRQLLTGARDPYLPNTRGEVDSGLYIPLCLRCHRVAGGHTQARAPNPSAHDTRAAPCRWMLRRGEAHVAVGRQELLVRRRSMGDGPSPSSSPCSAGIPTVASSPCPLRGPKCGSG